MSGFDQLAPEQQAVLQLLLKQGKSYDDIAGLLRLERTDVRERALDALDALGADTPAAAGLGGADQDRLADHLLQQQPAADRREARKLLEASAPARAWARTVAAALRPLAGGRLPGIPDEPAAPRTAEPSGAAAAGDTIEEDDGRAPQSSRRGGILVLLAVAAIVVAGLVVALTRGGDSPSSVADTAGAVAPQTGTTGAAATLPDQQVNLTAPNRSASKALGFAIVQQNALAFQAQGLPRSDTYVVWFWNSPTDALPLGLAKYLPKTKRVAGTQQGLPEESVKYSKLVITRQKSQDTTTPGPIVLSGPLKRG